MKHLYLLIDIDNTGESFRIAESLRHKPGVSFADAVTGPHDVIAILEGWDNGDDWAKTLMEIKQVQGVRYVTACYAVRKTFGNEAAE